MSDWIPAPEIENALLLFLDFPGSNEIKNWEGTPWLSNIGQWNFAVPYVFSNDPDLAEDWEQAEPEAARRFAYAAQTGSTRAQRYHAAFRRIFSRATTRKAILIDGPPQILSPSEIEAFFARLNATGLVCEEVTSDAGSALVIGMCRLHEGLFDQIPDNGFPAELRRRGIKAHLCDGNSN